MEQRLAERFQAALADEPPLGFDPDEVTDLAVSRQRRRGAVLGAATGTMALAIAAVALAGSSASPANEPASVASQPQVSTTSVTSATTSAPSPLGDVDAAFKKLKEVAPGVVLQHASPVVTDVMLKKEGGWRTAGEGTVFGVAMVFGSPGGSVTVAVLDESIEKIENYSALGAPVSDTTNADGSHTRVYRYADPDGERHTQVIRAQTNGVVISVGAAPALGVSEDTLVAIVNDPRLTF